MSTNSIIRFRESYETLERDQILRDAQGVDVAILSADLGMTPSHVRAYQRRLGLRTITESNGRGTKRSALDTRGRSKKKPK